MSKIIFLDIDETMNSVSNTIRCSKIGLKPYDFEGLNPISIALLKELINLSDAKIVLSSTWRLHYTNFDECKKNFSRNLEKYFNWTDFPLVGMTEQLSGCRGDEIKLWLDQHYSENYIILDDSSDMLESQMNNFVRVDYRDGFCFRDFHRCLEIFDISGNFREMVSVL